MNNQELQELIERMGSKEPYLAASSISDHMRNRQLLIAATPEYFFHVYLVDGLLHASLGNNAEDTKLSWSGDSLAVRVLSPPLGFTVYPNSADAEFANLLFDLGVWLEFPECHTKSVVR